MLIQVRSRNFGLFVVISGYFRLFWLCQFRSE